MGYRDFHPGDIALVYGNLKEIERVDKTHIATRAANDNLELWAYSEDLFPVSYSDMIQLMNLGFIYKDDHYIYDTNDGYVVNWKFDDCLIKDREGIYHSKRCETLGDVQQFFYQISGFELPLNYDS